MCWWRKGGGGCGGEGSTLPVEAGDGPAPGELGAGVVGGHLGACPSFQQNGEVESPLNLMVGRFDLTFVVIYLLPLLVLALSFNVLSEEREQGTLALTCCSPCRRGASWRRSSPSAPSWRWAWCWRSR